MSSLTGARAGPGCAAAATPPAAIGLARVWGARLRCWPRAWTANRLLVLPSAGLFDSVPSAVIVWGAHYLPALDPLAEGDKAITASTTLRMRALLRSIPPTTVLPTREAAGSCSSMSSAMKHWSMQLPNQDQGPAN